ncbi:N-acetylglucosamine repressor [Microbacterium hydrocarbonoxydans]|uniref:N-acetylglucosamine repressor n=1 Tax=Microbacterium hydrocarbonoxydans TaxID=273678 RepID=A0A0M2HQG0_9MICO|nr:ROK family transcriptional regulator [Microbacterium hydrocarbonoxydans]KJL48931.1 N-acetylglucosamine repressor [Microbacterium hydrocarbonoxydans]
MPTPPTGTSVVRAINARAALRMLLDRGPLSRPEIAALLAVSKPTASHLLAQLGESGLVKSDGNRDGAVGRAAELFRANEAAAYAAAMDITPERTAAVVTDLTGSVVGSFSLHADDDTDLDPAAQVQRALTGACAEAGIPASAIRRVVIGIQGAIDPTSDRLRFAAHLPGWQRPGLTAALQDAVGAPVDIENDVNLVAIAERAHGVATQEDSFAVLWVSDGIGMGLMFGGRVHRGLTGGAGEIAELPVPGAPVPQEANEFGASGMQAMAGGPALRRVLAEHGFTAESAVQAMTDAVAASGDGAASALDEIAARLALGLSSVVAIVDPDLIVLAGDLALAGGERLRSLVQHHLHTSVVARPPVLLSGLDGNPVLDGALQLAVERVQGEVLDTVSGGQSKPASDGV